MRWQGVCCFGQENFETLLIFWWWGAFSHLWATLNVKRMLKPQLDSNNNSPPTPPKKKGGKKTVLPSGGNCNPLIFWTLDGGLAVIFIKETHSKLFWHDHVRFKAARNAQLKRGRGQIKTETGKILKEEKDKLHRYGFVIILITVKDSGVWVNDGPRFS